MTLTEIKSAVASLLARADGALKLEVQQLSARVDSEVTALNDQLVAATAEINRLTEHSTKLDSELTATRLSLSGFNAVNEKLTAACLDAKLIAAETREDALAQPAAEKFEAYQNALNAAMLKANVAPTVIPSAPEKPIASSGEKRSMKLSEFRALKPALQSAFCVEVRAGRAQLIAD